MLGIVPVKILGQVSANDPLYASKSEPGVAVSGYHSQSEHINDNSLIGYAFQNHEPDCDNQVFILILECDWDKIYISIF